LDFSEVMFPRSTMRSQRSIAVRETPNVRAATAFFIPARIARTTRNRNASWALGARQRVSRAFILQVSQEKHIMKYIFCSG
jgi:hypothetical protein